MRVTRVMDGFSHAEVFKVGTNEKQRIVFALVPAGAVKTEGKWPVYIWHDEAWGDDKHELCNMPGDTQSEAIAFAIRDKIESIMRRDFKR